MENEFLITYDLVKKVLLSRVAERNQKVRRVHAKQYEPEYDLEKVEFNDQNFLAKAVFSKNIKYRTVLRYVQQNYEKYPIYSEWKTKTNLFTKTIRLTNDEIEALERHPDKLIRDFAFEIITELNRDELLPSWYKKICINTYYQEKIASLQKDIEQKNEYLKRQTQILLENIQTESTILKEEIKTLTILEEKIARITQKITKVKDRKNNVFKSVFTLFWYNYLKSQYRLNQLNNKKFKLDELKMIHETKILEIKGTIQNLKSQREKIADDCHRHVLSIINQMKILNEEKNIQLRQISPLKSVDLFSQEFVPLKQIMGVTYKKIIGCYIIRNNERKKYYVGQSKDVLKRLHQHFKGTLPKNHIFAEDYFTSFERETLFSVKIIELNTKDELDQTEKELIEYYDSWQSGYNGTSGNI